MEGARARERTTLPRRIGHAGSARAVAGGQGQHHGGTRTLDPHPLERNITPWRGPGPAHRPVGGLGAVSGGSGLGYGIIPYYATAGPNGVSTYVPPLLFMGPGGLAAMPRFVPVPVVVDRGPVAPPPPPGFGGAGVADQEVNKNKRKDPARAVQLTTMGDRLFRVGNLKKAEERYQQAARLDSDSAAPRVRLAQVALVREQYAEAAQPDSRGRGRSARLDRDRSRHSGHLRRASRFRAPPGPARVLSSDPS